MTGVALGRSGVRDGDGEGDSIESLGGGPMDTLGVGKPGTSSLGPRDGIGTETKDDAPGFASEAFGEISGGICDEADNDSMSPGRLGRPLSDNAGTGAGDGESEGVVAGVGSCTTESDPSTTA